MGKEKFIYNPQTLSYDKVVVTNKKKALRVFSIFSGIAVAGVLFTLLVWKIFPSPKERSLVREIDQLKGQYALLENQFGQMSNALGSLQERDAGVHRMLFGMDPIDESVWEAGVGGADRYKDVVPYRNSTEFIVETRKKADKLKRQIAIQSRSLDTLNTLAANREEFLAALPLIKPVREDKLKRNVKLLSGFGMRIHPIYKVPKMHTGIDFTAPKGTPIQATGNGKVAKIVNKKSGYGLYVVIDHGFGYETLYGHMSKVDVKQGQQVQRGQQIGLIGNTGTSTAPHLHYEVHYKGKKVNPINFVMDGLTPEEYEELKMKASVANQSFD